MNAPLDKDLQSIQQARTLAERCRAAQREFASASREQVHRVCEAVSQACYDEAKRLADMAHAETGYGNPEHKLMKNQFASRRVWEYIREIETVGVIERDEVRKMMTMAEPVGVVAALTPSTNPTSTAIFKSLIALKGRNGIVVSPHPSAARSTVETVAIIARAAEAAGAPKGLVSCLDLATYAGTQELLKHYAVNVILATGGGPMVRAAHSTGKPAYGVGPGNVPAWVDRSADLPKVARDLVNSGSFDCSLLCSTEQAIFADRQIANELRRLMESEGAYWVPQEHHAELGRLLFHPDGAINASSVGQSAQALASTAGFPIPAGTRVLVVPLAGVGRDHVFSREKLTSVMGFMAVEGAEEGLRCCIEMLRFGGDGHSAVLHSADAKQVEYMAARLPAYRIVVNSMSTLGAVGFTCGFAPSFTLGTGGIGGAVSSDNITVSHLINRKRVAWELNSWGTSQSGTTENAVAPSTTNIDDIVARVLARLSAQPKTGATQST
ncbi:MAG: aldehyde dehydrogenase family protein [Burkholderiaceae bacterium]